METRYKISPSTLKHFDPSNRFRCERCAWLKVKHGVRPPQPEGLGKFLRDTHDWFFADLKDNPQKYWGVLPRGRLIETELAVKAKPIHGIQLWGRLDGLIELESGGYAVIDLKTTQNTKWVAKGDGNETCKKEMQIL